MSKGTSGGSPWSGWPWDRTRVATPLSRTVNRTARCQAASAVLALSLFASCGRNAAPGEYQRLVEPYRRGELTQVVSAAKQDAAKFAANPRWQWEFKLLAAEALIGMGQFKDAEALLTEPPEELGEQC